MCSLYHDNIKETIEHLFFDCPATITRWFVLRITWEEDATIYQKKITAKGSFAYPFFMEVFMIGASCLWNERNTLIFDSKAPNFNSWKATFKKEVTAHLFKITQSLHCPNLLWRDSL